VEILGILLSIPAALVVCTLYCLFLVAVVSRLPRLSRMFMYASVVVLGLWALEVVLLVTLGAVTSRAQIGPAFYLVHVVLFFLGAPALANVLVLRRNVGVTGKWYVAAPICAVYAFILVLMQYGVSEALYGIDGTGGPYGQQW
jgi:hypothetical protein